MAHRRVSILSLAAALLLAMPAFTAEPIARTIAAMRSALDKEAKITRGGSIQPYWIDDRHFWFADGPIGSGNFFIVDAATGAKRPLFDTKALRSGLRGILSSPLPDRGLPFRSFEYVNAAQTILIEIDGHSYVIDVRTYHARPASEADLAGARANKPRVITDLFPALAGKITEVASPDGKQFITFRDNNLWLRTAHDEIQLTDDGERWHSWGDRSMGRPFVVSWSPDGKKIAALKIDAREVWKMPIVDWLGPHERVERFAYIRTGEPMPRYEAYIIDVSSKERVRVDSGPTLDYYLDLVGWSFHGEFLLLRKLNRPYNDMVILAADVNSGHVHPLITETSKTFVNTPYTEGPRDIYPLEKSRQIIYLSERTGWRQIYLYDTAGNLVRQLTQGEVPVHAVVTIDEDRGWVYFLGPKSTARPYDQLLYRVRIDAAGKPELLTPAEGQHVVTFSPHKSYFVDVHSSVTQPASADLGAVDAGSLTLVSPSDVRMPDGWAQPEEVQIATRDGRSDSVGLIIKPYNLDPAKKYPVVEAIYGGMQTDFLPLHFYGQETVFHGSRYSTIARLLANRGFVVVFINSPGTQGRGKAYHDATYGTWPAGLVEEHAHFIREVAKSRSYMDLSRIGIFGASWGGYMTQRALILEPEVYRAGVSLVPVSSHEEELFYAEPFLGLPSENPTAYVEGRLFSRVAQMKGALLLIPSTSDLNAPFAHTMKFIDALVKAQKDYELVLVPGLNHSISCCGEAKYDYVVGSLIRFLLEKLSERDSGEGVGCASGVTRGSKVSGAAIVKASNRAAKEEDNSTCQ